jgi:hypothetical protein
MKYLTTLILLATLALPACANSPTDKSIDDKANLQVTVQTFHRDMRWRRWESASMLVAPEKRQEFLGRYDELGEDFHISNLELKSLTRLEEKAIIDMEEESYKEPAMIVKKKRLIEIWELRDGDWFLADRMPKDDYKEMKKAETEAAAQKADQQKADQQKADQQQADTGATRQESAPEQPASP